MRRVRSTSRSEPALRRQFHRAASITPSWRVEGCASRVGTVRSRDEEGSTLEPVVNEPFDPWAAEVRADPHPMYRAMREQDPVYRATGPVTRRTFYFLTPYHPVKSKRLTRKKVYSNLDRIIRYDMYLGINERFLLSFFQPFFFKRK